MGVLCFYLCFVVQYLCLFILKRKIELVSLLLLSYGCLVTVMFCDFLRVRWVGLWCVIVVFPDHTHLLFGVSSPKRVTTH